MADVYSFTNHQYLAAANPALAATGDQEWDSRFADWLALDALARADIDFGPYAEACRHNDDTKRRLEHDHGLNFKACPKASAEWEVEWRKMLAAEDDRQDRYLAPMWRAARALALTPAPNLAAALYKVEVIKREELDNNGGFEVDPFQIVRDDIARLRGEAA